MNVLIAGCGYVGCALAVELVRAGHRVYGLRRRPVDLPPGVRPIAADLTDRAALRDVLPSDVTHLVYCASPSERTEEAYRSAYVQGFATVLDVLTARGAPIARTVFTSSTAVYGQDDGSVVDERSRTAPSSFTGRVLLEAEELAARGTVLRLAGIYGPGRTWLIRRVFHGEARIADPPRYGNRIHLADCAGALHHLLTLPRVEPIYIGVDDAPAPLGEVYRYVAGLLHVDPPREGEDADGRGGNKRLSNARLKASGYTLRVPTYREGYPALVREFISANSH